MMNILNMTLPTADNNQFLFQNIASQDHNRATIIPLNQLQTIPNMNTLNTFNISPLNNMNTANIAINSNYNQLLHDINQARSNNNNIIIHSIPSVPIQDIRNIQYQSMPQPIIYAAVPSNNINNIVSVNAIPINANSTFRINSNTNVPPLQSERVNISDNRRKSSNRSMSNSTLNVIPINNNNPFSMALADTKQRNITSLTNVTSNNTCTPNSSMLDQLLGVIRSSVCNNHTPDTAKSSTPIMNTDEILSVSSYSNDTNDEVELNSVSRIHGNVNKSNIESVRPYKCPYCAKSFSLKKEMRKHQTTHSGAKPYQCHLCAKQFGNNACLRAHIVTKHRHKTNT